MSQNHSVRAIDHWKISRSEILEEVKGGQISKEMICLGCAAKVPLVETVYPVLDEIKKELSGSQILFQPREDVYLFDSDGRFEFKRGLYSIRDLLEGKRDAVSEDIRSFQPDGVVLLASFQVLPSREMFKSAMMAYYRAALKADHPFVVGKGHTIQISKTPEEMYLMADYIRSPKGKFYGVANNDTISTIDPNLPHSSWISVFVGLNNALNDLFLTGVWKEITVYPSFDVRHTGEAEKIQEAIRLFAERFKEMGIRVVDQSSLGFKTNSMGATVVGFSDHEIPVNQNLKPGEVLIATRAIGDLAPLTEYLIRESLEEDTSDIEELRLKVLEWMLIPNVEAAKIISRYLPKKGEKFIPDEHLTACRDMTGPGLLALEELAEDSGVDIYLDEVRLFDERIASVEMPNPTSGTNGAIVIAAWTAVANKIFRELQQAGYEPWIMGQVMSRSDRPTIHINEELRRYRFLSGTHKGIFERYQFVPRKDFTTGQAVVP